LYTSQSVIVVGTILHVLVLITHSGACVHQQNELLLLAYVRCPVI